MSAEKINAINPNEVVSRLENDIPNELVESFNEMITKRYCNGDATVSTKEVVKLAVEKGLNIDEIYDKWLNNHIIERIYRKAGWKVVHDVPAYNESYEPYYQFSRRQNLD